MHFYKKFLPLWKFLGITALSFFILQIVSLKSLQENEKIQLVIPHSAKTFVRTVTTPPPLPKFREFIRDNYTTVGFIGTISLALEETIRFQGFVWLGIFLLKRSRITLRIRKLLLLLLLWLSIILFVLDHGVLSIATVTAMLVFNLTLFYYGSLLQPYLVHAIWNLLQPILYNFSKI